MKVLMVSGTPLHLADAEEIEKNDKQKTITVRGVEVDYDNDGFPTKSTHVVTATVPQWLVVRAVLSDRPA